MTTPNLTRPRMIPETCPSKATQGEKRLFDVLARVLPIDYYVWYEPRVNSRHPDFVILGSSFGLLVIEVKGWYLGEILRATDHDVDLSKQREFVERVKNPIRQAREYMFGTMDSLQKESLLRNPGGRYQGRLCFPSGYGVVFTNITRHNLDAAGLSGVFPQSKVLCRDELNSLESADPEVVLGKLKDLFDVKFNFSPLTSDQMRTIQGTIYKEVIVTSRPATAHSVPAGQTLPPEARVFDVLDHEQEQVARSIGDGHRVLVGVAGSGKTVVLMARARLLAADSPDRRILFVCYNRSFAAYVKAKLADVRNVHVLRFQEWAETHARPPRRDNNESWEDYESRLGTPMLRVAEALPESQRYDAVLIDEAIDFYPDWLKACALALKDRESGDLLIAVDGAQSIYGRDNSFTWKSVGVNAVGRTRELTVNFRNTRQIVTFAWMIAQGKSRDAENSEAHARVWPKHAKREGPNPSYRACQRASEELDVIRQAVRYYKSLGIPDTEIAVLYPRREGNWINELCEVLEQDGPVCWLTSDMDRSAKDNFMTRPGLRVSTIHSAKGLEFEAVIFSCLDQLPNPKSGDDSADANLMYVGLTRAKTRLLVTWSGRSLFTDRVENSAKATAFDLR
jgi:hypothetical protein